MNSENKLKSINFSYYIENSKEKQYNKNFEYRYKYMYLYTPFYRLFLSFFFNHYMHIVSLYT